MDKVIELKQVTYMYPLAKDASIVDFEYTMECGKFYGIIGENGAGKTTLCSILRGFVPSFYKGELTGQVLVEDRNIEEYTDGELASTMVLEPDILIIDEPASQLDPKGTENVFKIIAMLKREKKTIILVEHKVDMIAKYADEVLVLKEGRLVRSGKTQDILSDAALLEYGVKIPQVGLLGNKLITITHDMEFVSENLAEIIVMANKKVVAQGTPKEIFWNLEALKQAMLKQTSISQVCKELSLGKNIINIQEAIEEIKEICNKNH